MKAKMLQRRGLASQWAAKNPVLGIGEIGLETDTNKIKFGDGATPWNGLQYETDEGGGGTAGQQFSFSNSNGVSFGSNGSVVTASVQTNYQTPGAYLTTAMQSNAATNVGFAVPGSSVSTNAIVFSNNGNVTFGLNGNTISASAPSGGGGGSLNVSAGATSNNLTAITFSNGSGVTFGLSNSTITASVKTDYQTSGAYLTTAMQSNAATISNINVSAGTTSTNASAFTLSNGNGVSFGIGTGASVGRITATVQTDYTSNDKIVSFGVSTLGNTSGATGTISGNIQVILVGGNNVTLSQSGNLPNGGGTISITFSVGNYITTADLSQNSSKYAGINSGATNCSVTVNTSGVSVNLPNYLTTAMQSNAATISNIKVSAGASSLNLSAITFSDSNGISFGLSNNSVLTATVATNYQSQGAYLTTAALSSQTIAFSLGGNSATTNSSQISNGGYVLAGGNSLTIQQSNNSISFSVGNYLTTAALSQDSSKYAGTGFTTGTTTGAWTATLNTAGLSEVTPYRTRLIHHEGQITALTAPANASQSFQYFPNRINLTGTRIDALISMSAGSAATTATAALAFSAYAAIYTRNGATLSSLSSGSTQTTYSYASNTAGQTQLTQGAIRPMSVPVNFNMAPGEYFIGFNLITNTSSIGLSTTNLGLTMSIMGGNGIQTAANYAEITVATATSMNLYSGMGVYSVASTGLLSGVSLSGINQTGSALSAANICLVFRNA